MQFICRCILRLFNLYKDKFKTKHKNKYSESAVSFNSAVKLLHRSSKCLPFFMEYVNKKEIFHYNKNIFILFRLLSTCIKILFNGTEKKQISHLLGKEQKNKTAFLSDSNTNYLKRRH